jgi:leucyl-tRNA synthetase
VKLLSPICPHIAEELWEMLGHTDSISYEAWPVYDPSKIVESVVEVVVQVNGKIKTKLKLERDLSTEQVETIVRKDAEIQAILEGKSLQKIIIVPNKLVNIVVKE